MMTHNTDSQVSEVFDLFPQTRKRERKPLPVTKQRALKRRLGEVILGQRPFLKVHSHALQTDLWFVNEGLVNPADRMFPERVITMEMLAEMMAGGQPLLQTVEKMFTENV